jgi:hypothetical protein
MSSNLASLLFGDAAVEGVGQSPDGDNKVITWINANPPDLPKHQNNCAACDAYIPVYDTGWVILGDGALIHYSGQHGKTCWDRWHQMRHDEAAYKTMS